MPREVLFFDKDKTLIDEKFKFYKGVTQFIQNQVQVKGRECVITTRAASLGAMHLKQIKDLLAGYYGRDRISSSVQYYFNEEKKLTLLEADYQGVPPRDEALKKCILSFGQAIDFLVKGGGLQDLRKRQEERKKELVYFHKETGVEFDESMKYRNPNNPTGRHGKDLYLARELFLQKNPEDRESRFLMVGDVDDIRHMDSAPDIPLVAVLDGIWAVKKRIQVIVKTLFDEQSTPDLVFDECYAGGEVAKLQNTKNMNEVRKTKMDGVSIYLGRSVSEGRIIYEKNPDSLPRSEWRKK